MLKNNQPKKVMMVTECSMSDNIQVKISLGIFLLDY